MKTLVVSILTFLSLGTTAIADVEATLSCRAYNEAGEFASVTVYSALDASKVIVSMDGIAKRYIGTGSISSTSGELALEPAGTLAYRKDLQGGLTGFLETETQEFNISCAYRGPEPVEPDPIAPRPIF